ncbi:uncharacterized protein [Nicotiana sylvestris]|uniref:uncharacterized protein n=1 Tax=Nicotiana sylvestris TaxID=4096 RepID=UPI00388C85F7
MEMWDAWANAKEPRSAIPGFPELFPRASGTSNTPISYPNAPLGFPTVSAYFAGTPSESRPQVLASGVASNIFTAPPCSATAQPVLPKPNFDSSSFTFQAPLLPLEPSQFTTNAYPHPSWYEFIAGQEKAEKTPEQEEMTRKMRSMEQTLKNIQGQSGQKSVSYADLCMFPHVHLPLGFKTPKFEKYDGHGDPIAHLKSVFLQAQEADYYQNMMSALGKPFAEAIKIGEMVENGLKTGRILSQSAIRATSQAIQGGSGGGANRKKKEEATMATSSVRKPLPSRFHFSERAPQHYYPHQDAAYAMDLQPYTVMNAQPYIRPQQQFHQKRAQFPRNQPPHQAQYNPRPPQNNLPYNARAREPLRKMDFTPIGESYSNFFPKLVQMGLLQPVPPNRQNPESPSYQPGARCAYHSGVEGHDTESYWTLKRVIEAS